MSKISDYSAFTTIDTANDLLVGVDVSDTSMAASGTTKKLTPSQLGGAELFKYQNTSSGAIATGSVITGLSYKLPAGTLVVGYSFRLVLLDSTASAVNANLDLDTTQGTAGTVVVTSIFAGGGSQYNSIDFICLATGSSGTLFLGGVGGTTAAIIGPSTVTVNTTVDNWLEVINAGASNTWTNYAMIVTAT